MSFVLIYRASPAPFSSSYVGPIEVVCHPYAQNDHLCDSTPNEKPSIHCSRGLRLHPPTSYPRGFLQLKVMHSFSRLQELLHRSWAGSFYFYC